VTLTQNGSDKCSTSTVGATGTFRMQAGGPGGTVSYHWTYKDSAGTQLSPTYNLVVAAGDTAAHITVAGSWKPASSGSVQLVFTTPGYAVPLQNFTCR
jgi:hypothetical protein